MLQTDSAFVTTVTEVAAPAPVQELSVWDLALQGGWIMIPLAILSIISIYIFVERCIVIGRARRDDDTFMKRIKD